MKGANADVVLDVRLIGVRPDELDVDPERSRRSSAVVSAGPRAGRARPAFTEGALPRAETIAGAFIRNVEGRIAKLEATGDDTARREAAELRDVLRLGRLLLAGHEVTL